MSQNEKAASKDCSAQNYYFSLSTCKPATTPPLPPVRETQFVQETGFLKTTAGDISLQKTAD
ncbi:MAG: hypothetical protein B6247_25440 [Candidatus Parabeggiatoa sp. nov. 2]|nr:MAG: hypothetical protein B6247_25440 [Beggiatoa sp. 4572_84]